MHLRKCFLFILAIDICVEGECSKIALRMFSAARNPRST